MPRTPRRTPRPARPTAATAQTSLTASGYAGPTPPQPVIAPPPMRPGIELPGVRKSANAWWCPIDGTAQPLRPLGDCPICKRSLDYYEAQVEVEPEVGPEDE